MCVLLYVVYFLLCLNEYFRGVCSVCTCSAPWCATHIWIWTIAPSDQFDWQHPHRICRRLLRFSSIDDKIALISIVFSFVHHFACMCGCVSSVGSVFVVFVVVVVVVVAGGGEGCFMLVKTILVFTDQFMHESKLIIIYILIFILGFVCFAFLLLLLVLVKHNCWAVRLA